VKKKGVVSTPALGTPEEVSYFFFLLAFFAVEAFFFAMLFASSLSGVRAEGAGADLAFRKYKTLHSFLDLSARRARPVSDLFVAAQASGAVSGSKGAATTRDRLSRGLAY
jgi:hypothetical protein